MSGAADIEARRQINDAIADLRDRLSFLNSAEVEDVLDIFEQHLWSVIGHASPIDDGDA